MFKLMQAKSLWNSMKLANGMAVGKVQEHQIGGGGKAMSDEEVWNVDSPVTHNHYHAAVQQSPDIAQPKQSSGFWKWASIAAGLAIGGSGLGAGAYLGSGAIAEALAKIKQGDVTVNVPEQPAAEKPADPLEDQLKMILE